MWKGNSVTVGVLCLALYLDISSKVKNNVHRGNFCGDFAVSLSILGKNLMTGLKTLE